MLGKSDDAKPGDERRAAESPKVHLTSSGLCTRCASFASRDIVHVVHGSSSSSRVTYVPDDVELAHRPKCEPPQVTLPLNSNDRLYAEIRGMNIETVTPLLQARVRDLQAKESVSDWPLLEPLCAPDVFVVSGRLTCLYTITGLTFLMLIAA